MTAPQSPINIASYLTEMAQRQPTTDALLTNPRPNAQGKLSYTHFTFKQLSDQSDALARGFAKIGITPGTRTALLLRPSFDFFSVTFALFKLGAIPVLIDPGIGLKNFGRCLTQAQPTAFIGIPLAHLLRRILGWAKKTIRINITTNSFGGISLKKCAMLSGAGAPLSMPPGDDPQSSLPAAILFTSGSTGPAKGVLYTHENFNAQILALKQMYNIQPGEIDLATFPLFALFGPALGMTTVLPDMNFTRPGFVNPRNIIDPIQQLGITNMFGSPALIDRVSIYGETHHTKLPSLQRVISAGAPASAPTLARFSKMLNPDTQIFTPYGATEALPVTSIGSHEILTETRALTDQGQGVCIGKPVHNIQVRIIKITDTPIPTWSDALELPPGQIGEITVQGPAVTQKYFNLFQATALAKIQIADYEPRTTNSPPIASVLSPQSSLLPSPLLHRMGDVGYFDPTGRLWFCGRKSQRVELPDGTTLYSTPVEAIFNTHPLVRRSALVGIQKNGQTLPVICIELETQNSKLKPSLKTDLLTLAQSHDHTRTIKDFLLHPSFPVDIRHNAKINREQLAKWAQKKLAK